MPPPPPVATATRKGLRPYQQDRFAVGDGRGLGLAAGVFDGHGAPDTGHAVSALCRARFLPLLSAAPTWGGGALAHALAALEREALALSAEERAYHGSTACCAVVLRDAVVTANVGDSRAVLACGPLAPGAPPAARQLTRDHVPTDARERARIEAAGGWVTAANMLNGYIGMSRALGDNDLKAHRNITEFGARPPANAAPFSRDLLIADPEVATHALPDDALFLLLASDGVWHVMDCAAAAAVVHKALVAADPPARALVRAALALGAADNITAVVIPLSPPAAEAVSKAAASAAATATAAPARALRRLRAVSTPRRKSAAGSSFFPPSDGPGPSPAPPAAAPPRRRLRKLLGRRGKYGTDDALVDDFSLHGAHTYGGSSGAGAASAGKDESVHGVNAYGTLAALADSDVNDQKEQA